MLHNYHSVSLYPAAGTYRFFKQIMSNYGVECTFLDMTDLKSLSDAIQPNTKVSRPITTHYSLGYQQICHAQKRAGRGLQMSSVQWYLDLD